MIKKLFKSKVISNMKLQNSFFLSPMCMFSAEKGCLSQFQLDHYLRYAYSNLGAIILESTAVNSQGRITPKDLCIYDSNHIQSLSNFVQEFRKRNTTTKIGVQLSHSGSKGSLKISKNGSRPHEVLPITLGGWETLKLKDYSEKDIIEDFKNAAKNANKAGFDFIEIHMGHGYLFHQLISEKNIELIIQIFKILREQIPKEKPIGIRLSHGYSNNLKEDIATNILIGKRLEKHGCSYITLSNGGISKDKNNILFLKSIQQYLSKITLPLIVVGEMNSFENINKMNEEGISLFAIGRSLLKNPNFIYKIQSEVNLEYSGPKQYSRAFS